MSPRMSVYRQSVELSTLSIQDSQCTIWHLRCQFKISSDGRLSATTRDEKLVLLQFLFRSHSHYFYFYFSLWSHSEPAHWLEISCQSGANPSVPSNGRTRDNNNNSSNNNNNNNNNGSHCFARRPGSTRVALGVRKSCDASIVSSMRKVSLEAAASKGARDQLSSKNNPQQRDDSQQTTTTTPTSTSTTTTVTAGSTPTTVTTEVVLRDAMWAGPKSTTSHGVFSFGRSGSHSNSGNRLSVDHGLAKPRSRSLIWRPSRKSSRGSTCNDSSECSIT